MGLGRFRRAVVKSRNLPASCSLVSNCSGQDPDKSKTLLEKANNNSRPVWNASNAST